MNEEPVGLRERKKAKTRELIIATALELFERQGFEETTVAEIAAAAEISPRTFFGYFPAKEDVVFCDKGELSASFVERLRARPASENAFDAMRAWILELELGGRFDLPEERARRRLIKETPSLAAQDRANAAEFEQLLAEAVAEDLDVPPGSLRPHLVASAAIAALDAVGRRRDVEPGLQARSSEEVLDEALTFLQGGLRALRERPAEPSVAPDLEPD